MTLKKCLQIITPYTESDRKDSFIKELKKIPNVEEEFQRLFRLDREWRELIKKKSPQFCLVKNNTDQPYLRLRIFDTLQGNGIPVLMLVIPIEL